MCHVILFTKLRSIIGILCEIIFIEEYITKLFNNCQKKHIKGIFLLSASN